MEATRPNVLIVLVGKIKETDYFQDLRVHEMITLGTELKGIGCWDAKYNK
jgi:hypothetical protein